MLLGDFVTELADRLKVKDVDNLSVKAILARKINEASKEVGRIHDWSCLKIHGSFNATPNYVTGTVTITNDSRVITGSGTTWTASMVGRYFQSSAGANWYRIVAFNSATELVLETPIVETSGGGKTYKIWKRFYYLSSNVRTVKIFGKWLSDSRVEIRSDNYLIDREQDMTRTGTPEMAVEAGVDPFVSAYSTGTITLTKDSNVLTGVGTSWLENVESGERITVGKNYYRVKRVESDTRIVMWNYSTVTVSGSTYTIEKDAPMGFQLFPVPDTSYVIPYVGYSRVFDMINENKDRPPYPEDFDVVILDGAEASRMRETDDVKWIQKSLEFKGRIIDLKAMMNQGKARVRQIVPDIDRRGSY